MATKAKTTDHATPEKTSLESRLSEAIGMVTSKPEAASAELESLVAEASAQGHVSLARTARHYLANLSKVKHLVGATEDPTPEMQATLLLNARRSDEALAAAEKALAAQPQRAPLHYLKALALVQLGRFEDAAQALRQTLTLDPALKHQYLLEPDFNAARRQACFVEFEVA